MRAMMPGHERGGRRDTGTASLEQPNLDGTGETEELWDRLMTASQLESHTGGRTTPAENSGWWCPNCREHPELDDDPRDGTPALACSCQTVSLSPTNHQESPINVPDHIKNVTDWEIRSRSEAGGN